MMQSESFEVVLLLTVIQADNKRLAKHEIGIYLLKRQAMTLGVSLNVFYFQTEETETDYRSRMREQMNRYR